MRKIVSILGLVAIAASALFVSCAEKKTPDLIPAFPSNKFATYAPNDKGVHVWSFDSAYKYSNAKQGGFVTPSPADNPLLQYRIAPNFDWTVEVVGEGKNYLQICNYDVKDGNFASSVSGQRGLSTIGLQVSNIPESYEEAVECKIQLSMQGETMIIATITIEPAAE